MLGNKSTKVFSETNNFFTSTEKGIYRIMELYRSVKLQKISFGQKQAAQSTFEKSDLFLGHIMFLAWPKGLNTMRPLVAFLSK